MPFMPSHTDVTVYESVYANGDFDPSPRHPV
jgi:hypothetical protein